jgi:RNA-binding protein
MPTLTPGQRAFLRREAHDLNPIVQIGQQGLTDEVIRSTEQVLYNRELIKVKFLDFKDQKQELSEQLAEAVRGSLVAIIGNIAILYRENPDPDKREIVLPWG